jgi:dihydropteroate synthase
MILKTRAKNLDLTKGPLLMGILNVTPDSFSDNGKHATFDAALRHAERMIADGADMIDVGGESTRPGAEPVDATEELRRTVPIVQELRRRFPSVPVSIDTTKAVVARQCLEAGACLVNDISALRADPAMIHVVKEQDVPVVLMHMRGTPRTMQENPAYVDPVEEIKEFLSERMDWAVRGGLRTDQFIIDPGIGFGKTTEHNVTLLRNLRSFLELEQPLLVGASLKSFIGKLIGNETTPVGVAHREEGTLTAHLWAAAHGAHMLRVHDVAAHRRALAVWKALQAPTKAPPLGT